MYIYIEREPERYFRNLIVPAIVQGAVTASIIIAFLMVI